MAIHETFQAILKVRHAQEYELLNTIQESKIIKDHSPIEFWKSLTKFILLRFLWKPSYSKGKIGISIKKKNYFSLSFFPSPQHISASSLSATLSLPFFPLLSLCSLPLSRSPDRSLSSSHLILFSRSISLLISLPFVSNGQSPIQADNGQSPCTCWSSRARGC